MLSRWDATWWIQVSSSSEYHVDGRTRALLDKTRNGKCHCVCVNGGKALTWIRGISLMWPDCWCTCARPHRCAQGHWTWSAVQTLGCPGCSGARLVTWWSWAWTCWSGYPVANINIYILSEDSRLNQQAIKDKWAKCAFFFPSYKHDQQFKLIRRK